jgi:hypothetical protein
MTTTQTAESLADAYAAAAFAEGKAGTHLFPFEVENKVDVRMKARDALAAMLRSQAAEIGRLRTALEMAIRQNEHDMIMTGEELRKGRAALREYK